jgi:hypothetical protein
MRKLGQSVENLKLETLQLEGSLSFCISSRSFPVIPPFSQEISDKKLFNII